MSANITLSTKYLRVVVYVKIMDETIWFYGYECRIGTRGKGVWAGDVSVPMSHPVRSVGLDEYPGLLLDGKWVIFTGAFEPRVEVVSEVCDIALRLRMMQRAWDSLSPYEREYRVWC